MSDESVNVVNEILISLIDEVVKFSDSNHPVCRKNGLLSSTNHEAKANLFDKLLARNTEESVSCFNLSDDGPPETKRRKFDDDENSLDEGLLTDDLEEDPNPTEPLDESILEDPPSTSSVDESDHKASTSTSESEEADTTLMNSVEHDDVTVADTDRGQKFSRIISDLSAKVATEQQDELAELERNVAAIRISEEELEKRIERKVNQALAKQSGRIEALRTCSLAWQQQYVDLKQRLAVLDKTNKANCKRLISVMKERDSFKDQLVESRVQIKPSRSAGAQADQYTTPFSIKQESPSINKPNILTHPSSYSTSMFDGVSPENQHASEVNSNRTASVLVKKELGDSSYSQLVQKRTTSASAKPDDDVVDLTEDDDSEEGHNTEAFSSPPSGRIPMQQSPNRQPVLNKSVLHRRPNLPPVPPTPKSAPVVNNGKLLPVFTQPPPPPTLELTIGEQGIVISWNIDLPASNHCMDIEKYEIYAYQEPVVNNGKHAVAKQWSRVGDTMALKLPMSCNLSQVEQGFKYYVIIRAYDRFGRAGEFSKEDCIQISDGITRRS